MLIGLVNGGQVQLFLNVSISTSELKLCRTLQYKDLAKKRRACYKSHTKQVVCFPALGLNQMIPHRVPVLEAFS